MSELKERFLAVYKETVTREGSDSLLDWLEHSDFFVAPASTRYHGCYEGGLLQHSLNVYDCLKIGIEAAGLQGTYSEETIAIVSLMHDLCKVNYYKKGFRNVKDEETGQWYKKEVYEVDEKFPCGEHADKSIIILQNFIRLEPEEILAIRAHMGGWDTAVKGGNAFIGKIFERSKLALLLHLADMGATYLMEGVKYLSAQPEDLDRILGMAGKKVNRLEVSVGKNPELRAFIKECEHILLACT